jgi:hypothetical protein
VNSFFYTSASGWIASILIGVEMLLPYLLRRSRLSELLGMAASPGKPYLKRMRPHYWVGYVVLVLSLVHAWVPMNSGGMRRANVAGVWFATAALCVLMLQVILGLVLQDPKLRERRLVRRWHYWMMLALGFTVAVHIWLNS